MLSKSYSFLEYTGKVSSDNYFYYFQMEKHIKKNNKYKNEVFKICSSSYTEIFDPTIDNAFKYIFNQKAIIIKLLNDLLFPKKDKIKDVEFTKNDLFGQFGGKHEIGSKRVDLALKFKLYEECEENLTNVISDHNDSKMDLYDGNIKKEDLVNDLEMQLDFNNKNSERFIRYVHYIDANILSKKIWLIALIYSSEDNEHNKSSNVNYEEKKLLNQRMIREYTNHFIFEIDLNFFYKMMMKNEKIWILNKNDFLTDKGKEWIKLMTIPMWCKSYRRGFYAFPDLNEMKFTEKEVQNVLLILGQKNPLYQTYIYDSMCLEKEEKEFKELKKQNEKMEKDIKKLEKENKEKDEIIKKLKKQLNQKLENKNNKDSHEEEDDKKDEEYYPDDEENDEYSH